MKPLSFLLLLVASAAVADVGPRPPKCNVPEGCVTCGVDLGSADPNQCSAQAVDAGLSESECSDRTGAFEQRYFCPKGKSATRGCSSVDVLGLSALAALLLRRHRRDRER